MVAEGMDAKVASAANAAANAAESMADGGFSWAVLELQPALTKFDEALEAAVPNLVVAKPWLTELMRPLQKSLHKMVCAPSAQPLYPLLSARP